MNLQAQFNKRAIEKLPLCKAYLKKCNLDRAKHHVSVILRKISELIKPLDSLDKFNLNAIDNSICDYLKTLDD